jgi:hypothetical protein
MIAILPNTTSQNIYLTLKEKQKDVGSWTNYLVEIQGEMTREKRYFIANVVEDNARYTKITMNTNANDALNGDLLITETGQYWYKVYAQDSDTNLDPVNAIAEIERGVLHVQTEQEYYNLPTITLPDNIIYYD